MPTEFLEDEKGGGRVALKMNLRCIDCDDVR
jgi:hypothetical protein